MLYLKRANPASPERQPGSPLNSLLCTLLRCPEHTQITWRRVFFHMHKVHLITCTHMFVRKHTWIRHMHCKQTQEHWHKRACTHKHTLKCPLWPTSLQSPFTASKSLFHLTVGLGLWVTGNRMDLVLSLSQHCGLEGGLAQRSAPGGVLGGGWGAGGVHHRPARAQT